MFHKKIVFLVFLFIILLSITAAQMLPSFGTPFTLNGWTINTVNTGVVLLDSSTYTIDAHGICKTVQSADGGKYFIPTRTPGEWSTFINNVPSGIAVNTCSLQCNAVSWTRVNFPSIYWETVDISSDARHIAAAGNSTAYGSSRIYISHDGGNTYIIKNPYNAGTWYDIKISNNGNTIVAHSNGTNAFYISKDGGISWSVVPVGSASNGHISMTPDGQKIAVAGGYPGGYIYLSNDGGTTWIQQTSLGQQPWGNIKIVDNNPNIIYAIFTKGNNTSVYKTTDFGQTWQNILSFAHNKTYRFYYGDWTSDIDTSESGKYIVLNATMDNSTIYLSSDYGNTWTQVTPPSYGGNNNFFGITINDAGAFCIRRYASPICSFDLGTSFVNQNIIGAEVGGVWYPVAQYTIEDQGAYFITGGHNVFQPGYVYIGQCQ